MTRQHITLKTKLASALCQLVRYDDEEADWVRIISHEEAKRLSEDEILARFDFHHDPIPKAYDGPDVHWNLTPLPKDEHRRITSEIDIPRIAKSKRIRAREAGVKKQRKITAWRKFNKKPVFASRER